MNKKSNIDTYIHLLGCIPDKDIAELSGLKSSTTVQSRRKKLKIPSFRQSCHKIRASANGWRHDKDNVAAKNMGVPQKILSVFRHLEVSAISGFLWFLHG